MKNSRGVNNNDDMAAQNQFIRTDYVKAKIDQTQQNSKCRLCGDRDETIKCIISECRKLAQKEYKTRHDWVGKVIPMELFKKLKFGHTAKWHMHKPESVLKKRTHKILWDFEMQTDHLIAARKPNMVIINQKKKKKKKKKEKEGNLPTSELCHPVGH